MSTLRPIVLLALAGLACTPPWDAIEPCPLTAGCSTGGDTSTGMLTPTTDVPGPLQTVTGDGGDTGGTTAGPPEPDETSTGEPVNEPPQIFSVAFTPDEFTDNAGPATLGLAASADVVEVEIAAGGDVLATVPFEDFAFTFEVTSQAACHGTKTFTITVRDAEGLEDSATADLYCQLQASGSEIYTTDLPGLQGSAAAAVVVLPDDGVVVAGQRDGRMTLWWVNVNGDIFDSKSINEWSDDPKHNMLVSYATAVARDAKGAIFVGGIVKDGATLRRYVAKLTAQGGRIWHDPGVQAGEEIAGLAVAVDGRAFAAGRVRTSAPNDPPAYDARIWGYGLEGPPPAWTDTFARPASDEKPDKDNIFSERAHAVLALSDGTALILGEREYQDVDFKIYTRAWWQRYASDGARVGEPWTSPGVPFKHDAMRGGVVTTDGFALAGWGRHSVPGALTQVLVHRFDLVGNLVGSPPTLSPVAAQAQGLAQDREKKLVLAGYQTQMGAWSAWVFATVGADKPLAWEQIEPMAAANAVACGPWGRCTWVGISAKGALVSTRAP